MNRSLIIPIIGLCGIALASAESGCASPGDAVKATSESTGSAASPIFQGTPTSSHPEVAHLYVAQSVVAAEHLTATLVAPTLAVTTLANITGASSDVVTAGGTVCGTPGPQADKADLSIEVDKQDGTVLATANVTQVIANGQTDYCQGDIAFLVLDKPVTGITFPQLDLDGPPPALNAPVSACGMGLVDDTCTLSTAPLCDTGTVLLANGGPLTATGATYNPGYCAVSDHLCIHDGGGAMFDSTGAMYALSANAFDTNVAAGSGDFCKKCSADNIGIGTLLSSQKDFVARAFAVVGSSPWRKGHPQPAAVGGTCSDSLDCTSQLCVGVGATSYCSTDCETTACPSDTVCTAVGSRSVCLPAVTPNPQSCDVTSSTGGRDQGSSGTWCLALGAACFILIRRKKGARS